MSRTARGYGYITVIETENWNEWDLMPPEDSNIPKHTFLPDTDWGEWTADNQIRLTIGRGGNIGPQTSYRCLLKPEEDELTAGVLEQTTEVLSEEYDFDHDGEHERVELVTIFDSTGTGRISWLELCVRNQDNDLLWKTEAGTSHVSWNSIFALTIDEKDYLLQYTPYISTGIGGYYYCVFSLDEAEKIVYDEQLMGFELNFGSPHHHDFDPEHIAAFLTDVHTYLDDSTLLLSTEKGELRIGESGAEFTDDFVFWDDNLPYDESLTLEENLQNYKDYMTEQQAAEAKTEKSIDCV